MMAAFEIVDIARVTSVLRGEGSGRALIDEEISSSCGNRKMARERL